MDLEPEIAQSNIAVINVIITDVKVHYPQYDVYIGTINYNGFFTDGSCFLKTTSVSYKCNIHHINIKCMFIMYLHDSVLGKCTIYMNTTEKSNQE